MLTPRTLVVALAAMLLSVACGSDGDTVDDGGEAAPPTVTIVTYESYAIDEDVQAAVEERLGIEIEVLATGDAAEALSAALLTAGRPSGDVLFGVDNTLVSKATGGELLVGGLDVDWDVVPDEYELDASRSLVPVDIGDVCVDYDAEWFVSNGISPPTSFEDLTDPTYADLLVVESPVTSTPGLVFLSATYAEFGDGASDYWSRLMGNGTKVVGSWDDAWYVEYTRSGGDRPLVVSYASSPPAEVIFSETGQTEPVTGVVEATCARQIEFAGVLRGTEQPELAQAVVDAMISAEWQASLPTTNFVYPVRTDVEVDQLFDPYSPQVIDAVELDPVAVAEGRDAWVDEWRSIAE